MQLKTAQKGLILVAVPLVCEIAFVVVLSLLLVQAEHDLRQTNQSRLKIAQIEAITKDVFDASACLFAYGTTHNAVFALRFDAIRQRIPEDLRFVQGLVGHNAGQTEAIRRIGVLIDRCMELLLQAKRMCDEGEFAIPFFTATESKMEVERLLSQMVTSVHDFVAEEKKLEGNAPEEAARSRQMVLVVLAAGVVLSIVVALALARFFTQGITNRLLTLQENSQLLTAGKDLRPPLAGIDEIAEVDHSFHDMAKALREVERLKQEFFAMVSHDLRTPLTSVNLTLGLLEEGVLGEMSDKALDKIEKAQSQMTRLLSLINDLLDMEKLEAGMIELSCQKAYAAFLLDEAAEAVRALAESKQIEIVVPATKAALEVDADRIVQVLINLLGNAIKFSPVGSSIVLAVSESAGMLEFSVADQGRGIPKDQLDSVFDRFKQVERADAIEKKGSGLGLSICKAIVEQHGGTIAVISEAGKGSRFWFKLPLKQTGSSAGGLPITSLPEQGVGQDNG